MDTVDREHNRIWATVDLDRLAENYHLIARAAGGRPVMCVIKADAYGHGAVPAARRLTREGAGYFAVACASEALELRRAGIDGQILLLGYAGEGDLPALLAGDVTLTAYDAESAAVYSRAAVSLGRTARVHLKLDTGMSRLGLNAWEGEETLRQALAIARLPGIRVEGAFTHFAVADEPDKREQTQRQLTLFTGLCDQIRRAGVPLPLCHCANSAGVLQYKNSHLDLVRAGIILYGYPPSDAVPLLPGLRPVMQVSARVAQVRQLPAGAAISYGGTAVLSSPRRVAVVTAGYADGFLRTGSGRARVVVGGMAAPVLGRICMDMCMVDVTDCPQPPRRGDEAVLFGDNPQHWDADAVARAAGTISYEVLCAVSRRVPRLYLGGR